MLVRGELARSVDLLAGSRVLAGGLPAFNLPTFDLLDFDNLPDLPSPISERSVLPALAPVLIVFGPLDVLTAVVPAVRLWAAL